MSETYLRNVGTLKGLKSILISTATKASDQSLATAISIPCLQPMNFLGLHSLPVVLRVWDFSLGTHWGFFGRGYEGMGGQPGLIHGHAASGERS